MRHGSATYRRHRFPGSIIQHAVWLALSSLRFKHQDGLHLGRRLSGIQGNRSFTGSGLILARGRGRGLASIAHPRVAPVRAHDEVSGDFPFAVSHSYPHLGRVALGHIDRI